MVMKVQIRWNFEKFVIDSDGNVNAMRHKLWAVDILIETTVYTMYDDSVAW